MKNLKYCIVFLPKKQEISHRRHILAAKTSFRNAAFLLNQRKDLLNHFSSRMPYQIGFDHPKILLFCPREFSDI